MNLKIFFKTENNDPNNTLPKITAVDKLINRDKKRFNPPTENFLETFVDAIKDDVEQHPTPRLKSNLTYDERTALKQLSRNKNIVIKNADKGGAVVIQDATNYEAEALRQLEDITFYKRMNNACSFRPSVLLTLLYCRY